MKKVLFVADSLSVGGLEKSLIELLKFFDHDRWQVDLYLISDGRALVNQLHQRVNLLPDSPHYHDYYAEGVGSSVLRLLKKGRIDLCFWRLLRAVKPRFFRMIGRSYIPDTALDWKIKKKTMSRFSTHYDVAIGFAEGMSNHYVADCVDADVKIGWIHTDLLHKEVNLLQEQKLLSRLDHLVTVSENSKRSILQLLPELKTKIHVLPNLLDTEKILRMSTQEPEGMDLECPELKILSVGRLVELKGFHLFPEVCRLLLNAGVKLHWYVAGEGEYRGAIESEIRKWGVENAFTLLGNCENPYCYEKSADICVQASSYEGRAVVIEEMKFLQKPILVSDIPAFREVISHEHNGLIAARSPHALFVQLLRLCQSEQLRKALSSNLAGSVVSNQAILQRIYCLMENKV